VDAGVADHALEPARGVVDLLDLRVLPHHLLQVGLGLERVVEGDAELVADQLADLVDVGERQVEDAAHVADRGARLHRPVGDDLRDVAVLLAHVLEDLAAAVLAEVDVDVGVLGAVGVGEALEEQPVLDRARVGEAEGVADHGADAGAAGHRRDAAPARFGDEVPDDQEVGADLLAGEHGELALEAGAVGVGDAVAAVAPDEAGLGELA
jgi:hypothetical protein